MVPKSLSTWPTCPNPETYYANLWGCTDDGMEAKLQWKDYPAVNDVCSDSYVPMLWGVGGGLVLTLVTMILTFTRMDPQSDKTKCWCVFFGLLAIIWNLSFFLGVWGRCFHSVYDRDMHPHFGVGAYAYMILIILANWPNFIIHLVIPVYDEDLHASQEVEWQNKEPRYQVLGHQEKEEHRRQDRQEQWCPIRLSVQSSQWLWYWH